MTFDLVIRNGRLVDADSVVEGDLAIEHGLIAAIGSELDRAHREIDAAGRYVIPGGVDSHVHLGQLSSKGEMTADSFASGSRSAAHGGTTTVVPFAAQHRGMSISAVVNDAMQRASDEMAVDYGMHLIITDWDDRAHQELTVAAAGLAAVKIYLTYDRLKVARRAAIELARAAATLELPVMVHAEDDSLVSGGRDEKLAAGEFGAASHAHSHSREAEWQGVEQAIGLAAEAGAELYLAHISTPEAIELVQRARDSGANVFAETCPHYLLLDESVYSAPIEQAAAYMCSPPLRGEAERNGLLAQLAADQIAIVASDHSPYSTDQKLPNGAATKFTESANGLPGVELRLSILHTVAVAGGPLSMTDLVRLTSANPAKACGLHPRKGSLRIGADADIVIWDDLPWTVRYDQLHDDVGYTPYEGIQLAGRAHSVVLGGRVIVDAGVDKTQAGQGKFVGRTPD